MRLVSFEARGIASWRMHEGGAVRDLGAMQATAGRTLGSVRRAGNLDAVLSEIASSTTIPIAEVQR